MVFHGLLVLPFEGCNTVAELRVRVAMIARNPLLHRCLTMDVCLHLRTRLSLVCVCVCVFVCVCVCLICINICIYVYNIDI